MYRYECHSRTIHFIFRGRHPGRAMGLISFGSNVCVEQAPWTPPAQFLRGLTMSIAWKGKSVYVCICIYRCIYIYCRYKYKYKYTYIYIFYRYSNISFGCPNLYIV